MGLTSEILLIHQIVFKYTYMPFWENNFVLAVGRMRVGCVVYCIWCIVY